ncbi:MAG: hypothetical protein ING46_18655 [Rubrivivax sp.]|nr:hypothetical protein [Rubrivivax sp.]
MIRLVPGSEVRAEHVQQTIDEVLAVFEAIDVGELLAALPECEVARNQHQTALSLLSLARRQLARLRYECVDGELA